MYAEFLFAAVPWFLICGGIIGFAVLYGRVIEPELEIEKRRMNGRRLVKTFCDARMFRNTEVWVDTATGVNYLYHNEGLSSNFVVMQDANGKPIINRQLLNA